MRVSVLRGARQIEVEERPMPTPPLETWWSKSGRGRLRI